jgi:hypothetical protein
MFHERAKNGVTVRNNLKNINLCSQLTIGLYLNNKQADSGV